MSGTEIDQKILRLIENPATERSGFHLLYTTYSKRLYWHINGILNDHDSTNDVLQEVLVKAWKGLKSFRGDASIYSWLYRIATNQSITHLNKSKKSQVVSIHDQESSFDQKMIADEDVDSAKTLDLLQKALDTLPEKQRIVFCMRYFDEMSYSQISDQLNTSQGALKASYHHAVSKIEKFIQAHD